MLAAALVATPFLIPVGLYKAQIEQGVARATGRTFTIAGPVRFTLFPVLGIDAGDVTLSNPSGWQGPPLACAKTLHVGVRLLPLFSHRLDVTEAVLEEPRINLEVDKDGHANWTFFHGGAKPAAKQANAPAFTPSFSGMRVEGGSLTYSNARSKSAFAVDKLDAAVDIRALDKPVALRGTLSFRGQDVKFEATTPAPRAPLADQSAKVTLALTSALLAAAFDGTTSPDGTLAGSLKVSAANLRAAGAWLGVKLPSTGGFEAFSFSGAIQGDNRAARLSNMKLMLDGAAITGNLGLDRRGAVPKLTGALAIDKLDVDPYIAAPHRKGAQPHPHDKEQWSRDEIKLDALREFDADLVLDAGAAKIKNLTLGRTRIALSLKDRDLHARMGPMALYGGSGKAELDVDARGSEPRFHNAAEIRDVALAPFLTDTIGVKQIEGTGTIALDVSSQGGNADTVMRALSGKGSIDLRNGTLRGVDLGAMARTVQAVLNGAEGPGSFTDYSSITGSFAATKGVLTSNDFQLTGPLIQMSGAGNVDLGNRAIDLKVVPKIAKLGVPVHIKGPWGHVHYAPDLTGLVGGVLNNLASGKAPFKGLFGSSSKPPGNAPKKKHKSVGDALKNMLGIH